MAGHKYGEINYKVGFTIDKNGLQDLKNQLQEIQKMSTPQYQAVNSSAPQDLKKAALELMGIKKEAALVEEALKKAFNPTLGTTNIAKFNQEIKGLSLDKLYKDFAMLGPTGVSAFRKISTELVTTNMQFKQTHKLLDEMAVTFKNTIRYGISSSVFNNFTNSVSKAYDYVKRLDTSLNDIKIVSGQSADEMDRLAKNANKTAQALGNSTLDYTKAAQIYYQQGLSGADVEQRTEITLRMANVLGTSAKEVSNYMTAIWNNFEEGSKSLEYYADVITALGAATASSSEEIAEGLEKFSAIANTVGLSYEYATSALATVVAQTRQSADIVGTAFKTLFARIQDLELGKTLDDGTTLGKYAEALEKAGINIKNQTGELKSMNDILDEMGSKWQTLSKDEQVALAQNVAGTRQYTQLVSLMDNWDKFKQNLDTAANATGTLQKQQEIYMESTQAHLEKLGAAYERLMSSLIDSKGVNNLIDSLTTVVNLLSNFSESVGGSRGLLLTLGSIGTQVFSNQIGASLNTVINNLINTRQQMINVQQEMQKIGEYKASDAVMSDPIMKKIIQMRERLEQNKPFMSEEDINKAKELIDTVEKEYDKIDLKRMEYWETLREAASMDPNKWASMSGVDISKDITAEDLEKMAGDLANTSEAFTLVSATTEKTKEDLASVKDLLEDTDELFIEMNQHFATVGKNSQENVDKLKERIVELIQKLQELTKNHHAIFTKNELKDLQNYIKYLRNAETNPIHEQSKQIRRNIAENNLTTVITTLEDVEKRTKKSVNNINAKMKEYESNKYFINLRKEAEDAAEVASEPFNNMMNGFEQLAESQALVKLISGFGQLAASANALMNIKNIITSDTLSSWEKFVQITMALGTGFSMAISSAKNILENGNAVLNLVKRLSATYYTQQAQVEALAASRLKEAGAEAVQVVNTQKLSLEEIKQLAANGTLTASNMTLSASFIGLAQATWLALAPLLKIALVVAGAAAIVKVLTDAYNADADAAKEAAESVTTLENRYAECASTAEELKNTISDYSSALEEIEKLEKGTDEYSSALQKANDKAKELIETYKLFDQYDIVDGLIKIKPEALQQIQEQSNQQKIQLASEVAAAKIYSNQASLRSQTTNLGRTLGARVLPATAPLTNADFAIRNFTNEELSATVNAFNKITDVVEGDTQAIKERLLADASVPDAIKQNLNALFDTNGELKKEFIELANATKEATEANKYYAQQVMGSVIENKYGSRINQLAGTITDSNGQTVVNEARATQIAAVATQWASDATNQMNEALKNIDVSGSKVSSNSKLTKYLKERGASYYKIDNDEDLALTYAEQVLGYNRDELTYKGGIGKGTVKNKEGKTIVDEVNDKVMRREIAKTAATDAIKNQYSESINQEQLFDNLESIMGNAKEFGAKYGTDFTDALLNAITSEGHRFDFSNLYAYLDPTEVKELQELTNNPSELMSRFGFDEETIKSIGNMTGEEFAKSIKEGLENYKWSAQDAIKASLGKSNEDFEGLGLNTDELSSYAEHLMNTSDKAKDLADAMKYDSDAAIIVAKSVMRMNNGIDKLAEGLEEWEDILKKSSKTSEEYSEALNNVQDALADILDTEDELISDEFIHKYFKDIEKAAKGDAEAIDRLHKALAQQIVIEAATDFGLAQTEIDNLINKINNLEIPDIKIGAYLDEMQLNESYSGFLDTMGEIISAAHLTVDEANALFGQLGFQANFATEEVPTQQEVPEYVTETIDEGTHTEDGVTFVRTRTRTYQDGTYKATGKMTAIAMETSTNANGEEVKTPKITGLTKKATGNYNNYSSKNKGGKSAGGSNKPNKMDTLDADIDRYHKVNTQISKVDNALKKVQSQTDKLVGRDLIGNLAQQWNLLNTQIDNYNEKLRIANQEQNELANILSGKGVTFNADGTISNYAEVIKAQEAYVNSLINNYNSMSKDAQEKYQETVEKAKEDFEKFQTDLNRYDELISDFIPDLYQSIQDAASEKIELQIKQFNYKFEIRLELQQAKRDWDEFVNHYVKTHMPELMADQKTIYDSMGTRIQQNGKGSLQVATNQANQYREQYEKFLRGENNIFSANGITDQATALEKVKEAYEKVMEEVTAVKDAQKQAHENLISQLDESQEKLDQQRQVYTAYAEQINHDIKLIELLNDKPNYKQLSQYYEDLHKNNVEELDFLRQQKMMWEQQMSQFEQGSDEWYNARDKYLASLTELNSKTEESLDNIRKAFENTIEEMYETINNNMTNGLGLDYVQEEWSLINKNADQYLDKINQMQGIRNIEKKYVDAINKTNSAAAQQKINKLMQEELKDLNSRDKLSQYDLDRAEKKYQLLLAQIALEEAQANKSQMRLRRDSQGNYSYQFVADSDAINKARDEVEKLYSDLYNFDKDAYRNNLEEAQNIYIEWQEKRKEINLTYANDEEELKKQTALLDEQYQSLITGITSQNLVIRANLQESAFQDLAYLENQDLESFTNMTEAERNAIMEDLVPQWKSGTQEMVDALLNPQTGFTKVVQDAIDESEGAVAEYQKKTHEVSVAAGEDFDEIKAHSDPAADSVERLKTNTEIFLNDIVNNLQTMIDYTEQIDAQAQAYNAIAKALDAATKSHKLWIQEQETMAKAAESETPLTGNTGSQSSNSTSSNVTQSNSKTNTSAGGGDGVLTVGDSATFIGGKYYGDSYGGGGVGSRGAGKKVKVTLIRDDGRPYPIHVESKDGAYGWLRRDQLMGYDTGGYTGTWDDSGRLAMLHQKELVLNAQDTENMLNTVAIMRSMAYSLGSNLLAKMAGATVNGINGGASGSGALEQNVHIDAQFPNVHNAAEIENALNNLINAASQRIYERK